MLLAGCDHSSREPCASGKRVTRGRRQRLEDPRLGAMSISLLRRSTGTYRIGLFHVVAVFYQRSNAHGCSLIALSLCPANGSRLHRPVGATDMTQPLRLTAYPG